MDRIELLREQIDQVDHQIVALFEQRMELTDQIALVKLSQGLPVLDQGREAKVYDSRVAMLENERRAEAVIALYQRILEISRKNQEQIIREREQ